MFYGISWFKADFHYATTDYLHWIDHFHLILNFVFLLLFTTHITEIDNRDQFPLDVNLHKNLSSYFRSRSTSQERGEGGDPGGGLGRPRPRARRLFTSRTLTQGPASCPGSTESEAEVTARSLEDIMRSGEEDTGMTPSDANAF